MQLNHLSLTQFRNFARLDIDVPSGVILIVGDNAQGKTSILEAIYFLATFSSFHAESDRQLINFIEGRKSLAVARIVGDYVRSEKSHRLEVSIVQEESKNGITRARKEIWLDKAKKKVNRVIGHFQAVLFLPQMLSVIEGSPGDRRRYLDMALSQVIPEYAINLSEYNRVLSQRNALLKQLAEQGGDLSQLDFWDERLVLRGAAIVYQRIHAVQALDRLASGIHLELTRGDEVLRLNYKPAYEPLAAPTNQIQLLDTPVDRTKLTQEKIQEGFMAKLSELRNEQIARGVTTIGPHRDELRFLSNGIDLGTYGSRGQVRTTMLSMKLAEMDWMKDQSGNWPVLLLDEVLAELDSARRTDLLKRITASRQAVLTTTDLGLFDPEFVKTATVWNIESGRLKES